MAEGALAEAVAGIKEVVVEAARATIREDSAKPVDAEQRDERTPRAESAAGQEIDEEGDAGRRVISDEEHEENIVIMGEVLHSFLDVAAGGGLPTKEEKIEFQMKERVDSTSDLLTPVEEIEEELTEEELVFPEGSCEEVVEEEEVESKSMQEMLIRRQQLMDEFDAVHDEGQSLRLMNMLLQSRVMRCMRRTKTKPRVVSSASTASTSGSGSAPRAPPPPKVDTVILAETLEKELLEAGEVRRQLEVEIHRNAMEQELRQRLSTAREQVAQRSAQLQQLQEKVLSRMRAPPSRRQDAERILKRVWPQLLRLRKERLLHLRAKKELEDTKRQVAELEVFGKRRTVATYEDLLADGVKLSENVQERVEQLTALRNIAERDLQQAGHLREALQGAHQALHEARYRDGRASMFLQKARKEVLKTKKLRDDLHRENRKLACKMELLSYPGLLRDHEEVRRRLRQAQAELEKLRTVYVNQEMRIAAARKLLQQREQILLEGEKELSPQTSFFKLQINAKCGTSGLDFPYNR